jgi:trehalose/maltose hydrolase-like predicted phosphorylase
MSALLVSGVSAGPTHASPSAAAPARADRGFVLTTTQPGGPGMAPAFVGNGYLAGRQPFDGQGYAEVQLPGQSAPLPTQSEVHGLYALGVPAAPPGSPPQPKVERRAALPAWSTLSYDDGSGAYRLSSGTVSDYRQSLDLRTGTLTTSLTWTSPAGNQVGLRYDVTPDRARRHAAAVRLRIVPHFTGHVTVTDVLDGQAAELLRSRGTGHQGRSQWVDVTTPGLHVNATEASTLVGAGRVHRVASGDGLTAKQAVSLDVRPGQTYTVTKYVGIATATDSRNPHHVALSTSRREAHLGYAGLRRGSDAAWARLWRSDIVVSGDARLQRQVRASFFALLASVRQDTPWAPSPGGLSSDGYNGHVFWDSETWMYPSLLATEPAIARESLEYRFDRLDAARANARQTGWKGARFPWESALRGSEETPAFANTGKLEIHVNADIALAVHQYWLATGDRRWLATRGWPILRGIAEYYTSRVTKRSDGTYSIRNVIPPDEYAEGVDDSVYTNMSAAQALRFAAGAAQILHRPADPRWTRVARGLRILFDATKGIHPEYAGYPGDAVKQADVTLLSYPWEHPQPRRVTRSDLDYYVPRTDPGGPSMTDAIHSIVTSQLGTPGCAAFSFTRRSVDPFLRPPYDQFAEARSGGAFTFTTGTGGFLQEFLYGYTGFRWRSGGVWLDPSLPPQLSGVRTSALHWRGRTLSVAVGPQTTQVTLKSGSPVRVSSPDGSHLLRSTLVLPTRRPDQKPTPDLARCRPATASPATAEPAESADDGTVTTQWIGDDPSATVTVDLGASRTVGRVTLARNDVTTYPAPPGGDKGVTKQTVSASARVEVSTDGTTWRTLGTIEGTRLRGHVAGDGAPVRYLRLVALGATADVPLIVGELGARG